MSCSLRRSAAARAGRRQAIGPNSRSQTLAPVILGRAVWDLVPDEGARALVPVLVPCDDLGAPGDVDRPDDLPERLRCT